MHSVIAKKRFMKGVKPIATQLLNLPDVRDISVNADAFKVSLDRYFHLIKEKYKEVTSLKELIDELDNFVLWNLSEHVEQDGLGISYRRSNVQSKNLKTIWQILTTSVKKKKSKNRRYFGLCQQMTRLLILTWDSILFAAVDVVEKTLVRLAEEDSYSCWSRKKNPKGTKRSCYVENNLWNR